MNDDGNAVQITHSVLSRAGWRNILDDYKIRHQIRWGRIVIDTLKHIKLQLIYAKD